MVEDLVDQYLHSVTDLVADSPHGLERLPGWVGEVPVLVTLAWEDRACFAAAHRDYYVGVLDGFSGEDLRGLSGDVDADLAHRLEAHRIDLFGGLGPS